ELVFQPFQRLGQQAGKGVGLGLAVSRGLLEAMGNNLIIENTPGGGTTMVIEFKTSPSEKPAAHIHQGEHA
ncbi:MAG TPA: ATP-binding protein, partial [Acidimicrobiia bacterium]|nr:ATP-binding protein [Acidimicrobiia bacterium]